MPIDEDRSEVVVGEGEAGEAGMGREDVFPACELQAGEAGMGREDVSPACEPQPQTRKSTRASCPNGRFRGPEWDNSELEERQAMSGKLGRKKKAADFFSQNVVDKVGPFLAAMRAESEAPPGVSGLNSATKPRRGRPPGKKTPSDRGTRGVQPAGSSPLPAPRSSAPRSSREPLPTLQRVVNGFGEEIYVAIPGPSTPTTAPVSQPAQVPVLLPGGIGSRVSYGEEGGEVPVQQPGGTGDGGECREVGTSQAHAGTQTVDDDSSDDEEEDRQPSNVDRMKTSPFFLPEVPEEDPTAGREADTDGRNLIGKLSAWDCLLCPFGMLADVPEQHEEIFVKAWASVLGWWREAKQSGMQEKETESLKWLLFICQALLRKPRRGGKKGTREVAKRFNFLVVGDWGSLVEQYIADVEFEKGKTNRQEARRQRNLRTEEEVLGRSRRQTLASFSEGQIGRGLQRLTSPGLANAQDPEVQDLLRVKYPPRVRDLPETVVRGQAVESLRGLREALVKLQRGVAPGCGGCRNEYLSLLGERLEEGDMQLFEEWGMAYIQAELPCWFYTVALSVQTVALFKTFEQEAVRPLGLRFNAVKILHKQVATDNNHLVREAPAAGAGTGGTSQACFYSTGSDGNQEGGGLHGFSSGPGKRLQLNVQGSNSRSL